MRWLVLAVGIATNAAASLLVKRAVTPPRRVPSLGDPLAALTNVPLLVGLVLYGASFVAYAAALTMLPINVAHPVLTSGAIAVVAVASVLLVGEQMPWTTVAGVLLVMAGVVLISLRLT